MVEFVIKLAINAAAILAAVQLVPGLAFDLGPNLENWWKLALIALIFGAVNTYLKPIVKLLSLPVTLLTMGLAGLIINTGMVLLVAYLSSQLRLGFTIYRWPEGAFTVDVVWAAFLASIVISVVALALSVMLGQKKVLGLRV